MPARTAEIEVALRKRYPETAYSLLFQVPNGTGGHKTRTADALVFGLWPSRGLDIEGVEIKASRADWRKEIEDPTKASAFSRFCHRWWIAAPPGVVESGELPPQWGLLELKRGVLRQAVEAPRSEPETMPYRMWIAVMRAVQNEELRAVRAERKAITDEAEKVAMERYRDRLASLTEGVERFKEATGIDVRYSWNVEEIGKAMGLVREGRDHAAVLRSVNDLAQSLRRVADQIDEAVAVPQEAHS